MPNMGQAVANHNKKILNKEHQVEDPPCNCRGGMQNCPVDGKCKIEGVVYKAKISETSTGVEKHYIGMTGRSFKRRWDEHKTNFNKKIDKRNPTKYTPSLYTHVWDLRDKGVAHTIEWEILDRGQTYSPVTRKCMVCLKEKYHILYSDLNILNKRDEIFSRCRHLDKKRLNPG